MSRLSPLTTTDAVVTRFPEQHLYVPLSWHVRSWICSCALQPSCFISYLFPGLSRIAPFFHCTSTPGLESSQQRKAVSPSSASWLWSSSQKKRGCSEKEGQIEVNQLCRKLFASLTYSIHIDIQYRLILVNLNINHNCYGILCIPTFDSNISPCF